MTNRRPLRVEPLEQRLLLAGDTYLINFQPETAPVPTRYAVDFGALFGPRSNGWSYGWSTNHTLLARDRELEADQRLDTLIHFHQGASWELTLPNGLYEVTASIGDPQHSSNHTLIVEGTPYWSGLPLTPGDFRTSTMQVSVNDGRLTLTQGAAGEMATRINYVHVVGLPNGPNDAPATPTIMEPTFEGIEVNPADVHMEAVDFSDPNGHNHLSTDWEIWTVGSQPQRVWHTLGITGVERLHTHLGDGIFENSHAGRTDLISETLLDFNFNTYTIVLPNVTAGDQLTIMAEMLDATGGGGANLSGMVDAFTLLSPTSQNLVNDGSFELAAGDTQTSNSSWVMTTQHDGVEPSAQFQAAPWAASSGSKGVWFKGFRGNAGAPVDAHVSQVVTATVSGTYTLSFSAKVEENFPTAVNSFRIAITSSGTGGSQSIELLEPPEYELRVRFRDDQGAVSNYATRGFRVGPATTVFPLQLEDIASSPVPTWLLNDNGNPVTLTPGTPTQPQLRLEGAGGELLLSIAGHNGSANNVTNPPALADHVDLRVVITGGSNGLNLGETDLHFFDDHGQEWTVYLPAIDLGPNQRLDLWVAAGGDTYFGNANQTEPDFSDLARESERPIPFIVLEPGYIIEEIAGDLQLPVNIAFVPNPGPDPDDPLFYINELYGTIKVVTRDLTVSDYATGLLNFDPTGAFPGSGEQGLAGLVVDPITGDVFVTRVTDTDGLPGGVHHPQVVRLHSNDGGLTAASVTVIRNMVGESQGQSHQVSNATIGPDGKLYVHNGDGFDPSTALNLNSYRGKILRMNLDGTAPTDNPLYNAANGINSQDFIYAYGFRNPFGGAWRASDGKHYEVENGVSIDRLVRVDRGGNYDWNGSDASFYADARYIWNPAHAPVNITFIQPQTFGGSQFPLSKQDHAFVSESGPTYGLGPQSDGKRILEFQLDANGNVVGTPTAFVEYVGTGRATVAGLAAGPDGLYFTELYKDENAETPIDAGARVFRIRFAPAGNGDFNVDGNVDAADYVMWRKTLGTTGLPAYSGADGDGDTAIDLDDHSRWTANFGRSLSGGSGGSSLAAPLAALQQDSAAADPTAGITREAAASRNPVRDTAFDLYFDRGGNVRTDSSRAPVARAHPGLHQLELDTLLLLSVTSKSNDRSDNNTSPTKARVHAREFPALALDRAFQDLAKISASLVETEIPAAGDCGR